MKNNLKLIISFFVLSIITLISSVFAWVNISRRANLEGPGGNIGDFTNLVTFEVSRLSEPGFIEITDDLVMMQVFGYTKPGEAYTFRINVENTTVHSFDFFAVITGINNDYSNGDSSYDLRNVFYIENGEVLIDGINFPLTPNDTSEVNIFNQTLNDYRLSNLTSATDLVNKYDVALLTPYKIDPGTSITVEFTLVYDPNTNDIGYQDNRLLFDGIYLYGQ